MSTKINFFENDVKVAVTEYINTVTDPIFQKAFTNPKRFDIMNDFIRAYWNMLNTYYFDALKLELFQEARDTGKAPDTSIKALAQRLTKIQDKFFENGCVPANVPLLPKSAINYCAKMNTDWFTNVCDWTMYTRYYVPKDDIPVGDVSESVEEKRYSSVEFNFSKR